MPIGPMTAPVGQPTMANYNNPYYGGAQSQPPMTAPPQPTPGGIAPTNPYPQPLGPMTAPVGPPTMGNYNNGAPPPHWQPMTAPVGPPTNYQPSPSPWQPMTAPVGPPTNATPWQPLSAPGGQQNWPPLLSQYFHQFMQPMSASPAWTQSNSWGQAPGLNPFNLRWY